MKKLLFATTALVATAGMAAAEIKFSGYGRFGLKTSDSELTVNDFDGKDVKSQVDDAETAMGTATAARDAAEQAAAASRTAMRDAAARIQAAERVESLSLSAASEARRLAEENIKNIATAGAKIAGFNDFEAVEAMNNNPAKPAIGILGVTGLAAAVDGAIMGVKDLGDDATAAAKNEANAKLLKDYEAAQEAGVFAMGSDSHIDLGPLNRARAELEKRQNRLEELKGKAETDRTDAERLEITNLESDSNTNSIAMQEDEVETQEQLIINSIVPEIEGDTSKAIAETAGKAAAIISAHDAALENAETAEAAAISAANAAATEVRESAEEAEREANANVAEANRTAEIAEAGYKMAQQAAQKALERHIFAGLAGGKTDESTDVTARYRVNMDIIQETDSGLKFEGRVRLQGDNGSSATLNAPRFSVSHGGFRLDVGNVGGAIDNMAGYYGYEPGLTAFAGQYSGVNFAFDGYSSTGNGEGNNIQASYAVGNFATTASWSDDGAGMEYGGRFLDSEQMAFNAAWSVDAMTFAIGYAQASSDLEAGLAKAAKNIGLPDRYDSSMLVATAQAALGDLGLTVFLGKEESDADPDELLFDAFYGLSAKYQVGAATNLIFSYGDGAATFDKRQIGLGITHDLGGAMLKAGIAQSKIDGEVGGDRLEFKNTTADFGVQFNF